MLPFPGVDRIGRFEVLKPIGEGGMAAVYLALDLNNNQTVAVKVMHDAYASDADFVERFRREADMAFKLDNPNIVRIIEYGVDQGRPFIAMEYMDGRTVKDYLRERGALPVEIALDIITQSLRALDAAYRRGIVHRDISSVNLQILADGRVKVMDFGIARDASVRTLTQEGIFLGNPFYVSPEQALGRRVDIRSDIYSLGIVLYEMLAGVTPFNATNPAGIAYQHVNSPPCPLRKIRPSLPEWVEALVLKCVAKDPSDRFQSPAEVLKDIAEEGVLALEYVARHGIHDAPLPEETPEPVMTGARLEDATLRVRCNVKGARVFLDDTDSGAAPAVVETVEGPHMLRVERKGYGTYEQEVRLKAFEEQVVEVELRKLPRPAWQWWAMGLGGAAVTGMIALLAYFASFATIMVDTDPPGALVTAFARDGVTSFGRTPASFRLRPGEISSVQLTLDGYIQKSVPLGDLQAATAKDLGRWRLTPRSVELTVAGTPAAEVELDGVFLGLIRPDGNLVQPLDAGPGRRTLRVTRPGYREFTTQLGDLFDNVSILARLEPLPTSIRVTSIPSGADVVVNGRQLGVTPLTFETALPRSTLELVLANHDPWSDTLTLPPGAGTTLVEARLTRTGGAAPGAGVLQLGTLPARGRVELSLSEQEGASGDPLAAPARATEIATLSAPGHEPIEFSLQVPEGRLVHTVQLTPSPVRVGIRAQAPDGTGLDALVWRGDSRYLYAATAGQTLQVELRPGTHEFHLRAHGYAPAQLRITRRAGDPFRLETLTLQPARGRTYQVITDPPGALIVIDGRTARSWRTERGVPFGVALSEGVHDIRIELDGYRTHETRIEFQGDEQSTSLGVETIRLEPLP